MLTPEALRKRLLVTFKEEAAEHVQAIDAALKAIAAEPKSSEVSGHLETIFRLMHTLKGAARSVRLSELEQTCQESETLLRRITQGELSLTDRNLGTITENFARMTELVFGATTAEDAEAGGTTTAPDAPAAGGRPPTAAGGGPMEKPASAPTPAASDSPSANPGEAPAPKAKRKTSRGTAKSKGAGTKSRPDGKTRAASSARMAERAETIRVDIARLDTVLLVAEDLLLPSMAATERVKDAQRITAEITELRALVRSDARPRDPELAEASSVSLRRALSGVLRDLETRSRRLARQLAEDRRVLNGSVNELFGETRRLRMFAVAGHFVAFPAMVQDICKETGKKARWRLDDNGLELDRKVIEAVRDPLLHLVRNAIDHGIETPERRREANKPEWGEVRVTVSAIDGARVAIDVSDDGCGMDLEALREAAIRARVAPARTVRDLSAEDVIDLAFRSGVSTRSVISNISGFGKGLSIVREQVERVEGRVIVRSEPGTGTTVRLELPTSIASYRGLLVRAGGMRLLWPLGSVERVVGIALEDARRAEETGRIVLDGRAMDFRRLTGVLALGEQADAPARQELVSCAIATDGLQTAVYSVDEVLGETDVLVKDLPLPLRRVRHITSAGLLSTGDMALVLRPSDILASGAPPPAEATSEKARGVSRVRRILVVDDSMTTRTMERNLLESVGYAVQVAADGMEAWEILQTDAIDLVVSDVDMPRMDGFTLTEKIRASEKFADLPIVLVTALEDRADRERGLRIGANAYVLKSGFDQSNLHEIVGMLL